MAKLVSMERISLKSSKDVNEKMIQEYIFENPSCLGLGELTALTKEKSQPAGGRLDLLMADDNNVRYEIEIQLSETQTYLHRPSCNGETGPEECYAPTGKAAGQDAAETALDKPHHLCRSEEETSRRLWRMHHRNKYGWSGSRSRC